MREDDVAQMKPSYILFTFVLFFLCMSADGAFSADGSETARIYVPGIVSPGREFPVVVRVYESDGSLASGIDGEFMLRLSASETVSVPLT